MMTIHSKFVIFFYLLLINSFADSEHNDDHEIYCNGFKSHFLKFDGEAQADSKTGLLQLTNHKKYYEQGHAFYSTPFQFKTNLSFSTTFVFAIASEYGPDKLSGQGMAFVIAPQRGLPGALANQFLGLFNDTSNGKTTNHVFAVELDGVNNVEFDTVMGPHVGIDINSLKSVNSTAPAYFADGEFKPLNLTCAEPMQVWIDYDGIDKQISVTLAPINVSKPDVPLLLWSQDLSTIFLDSMYVGFSASTQTVKTYHYILGWSFQIDGAARALNLSSLPELPQLPQPPPTPSPHPPPPPPGPPTNKLIIALSVVGSVFILALIIFGFWYFHNPNKDDVPGVVSSPSGLSPRSPSPAPEIPVPRLQKYSFNELEQATKGFNEDIGGGAFGTVYRGVLPNSGIEVAVKKLSRDAKYGSEQFVAEIDSLGKLSHLNLVQLHGYCVEEGELLLVYDFMANGSLDKFLHPKENALDPKLKWSQRYQIIKDIASGLEYMHNWCNQVLIHRDIKSSNVLLDGQMNARLGDFGFAKWYDRGSDYAETTKIVGTHGYIAPELNNQMPSTQTDVYAFGAFLLEVACGRRPNNLVAGNGLILVGWVLNCMREGIILNTVDKKLEGYKEEEMLLVLKLGLLCCRTDPTARPTIKKIVKYLSGDASAEDLRALNTMDEAPVLGEGSTSPVFGTCIGSTSSGNAGVPFKQSGSPSSANDQVLFRQVGSTSSAPDSEFFHGLS